MKKLFALVVAALMLPLLSMNVMAGDDGKKWNFAINDDGECEIEHVFSTQKDNVAAMKAFKSAINRQTFEERDVKNEEAGQSISYKLRKNTKSRFNPFAGNFNESMSFDMVAEYAEGQIKVKLDNFVLRNEYEGYGKRVDSNSFSGKIGDYNDALAAIEAGAKGKAKKEAKDIVENVNESLNECQLELDKMFQAIQKAL